MKILAIRGENIASLEAFDVDLEKGTLGQVGLFAITGPTGAGKSTILDALCLALFDKTPRLQDRSTVRPGRPGQDDDQRLTSTDTRNLLKKGAAAGFAEADFIGKDGGRYRARWEVRRARNRADGRIQSQSQTLRDLVKDVDLSDGRRTETLRQIQALLGLDFDQFRRSALLAQGDFAAFLRANEGERAELLEAMTDTGIYGRLGKAAYDRARQERELQGRLNAQLQGVSLLTEEEHQQLRMDQDAALLEQTAATAALDEARGVLEWQQRDLALASAVNAAQAELVAAQAAWEAAESERLQIAQVQDAEPLRPVLQAARDAEEARKAAEDRLERLKQEQDEARAGLLAAQATAAHAQARRDAAQAARSAAATDLDAASVLDTRLKPPLRISGRPRGRHRRPGGPSTRPGAAAAAQAAVDQARAQADGAQTWLAENKPQQRMVEEWADCRPRLAELVEAQRQRLQLQAELNRQRATCAAAEAALQPLIDQRAELDGRLQKAVELAEAADARAAETPVGPAELRWSASDEESRALLQLRDRLDERQRQQSSLNQLADELTRVRGEQEAATRAVAEHSAEEQRLAGALLQAQGQEAGLRLALDVSVHRDKLVPGESCPLCGSLDHPWVGRPTPIESKLAEQEERLRALRAESARAHEARAQAEGQHKAATTEASRLLAQHQAAQDRAAGLETACLPLMKAAHFQVENADLDFMITALQERLSASATQQAAALAALRAARQHADAARAAHLEASHRQRERVDLGQRLDAARARRDEEAERLRDLGARLLAIEGRLDGRLQGLSGHLAWDPDWQAHLLDEDPAVPAAFLSRCDTVVRSFQAQLQALAQAQEALQAAQAALQPAQEALTRAQTQAGTAADALPPRQRAVAELTAARADLLGGEPTAGVRARLDGALAQAESAWKGVEAAREAAARGLAEAEVRVTEAEQHFNQASALAQRKAADRDAAVSATGRSPDEIAAALAQGADWLPAALRRQEQLKEARQRADSKHLERADQLQEHRKNAPDDFSFEEGASTDATSPEGPLDAARARFAQAQTLAQACAERAAALKAQVAADAHNRQRSAGLVAQIAAQDAIVQRWDAMAELIGSADGKKLRVFAQSLTLEALVAETNHHLKTLARRYRLERVDGSNLDLQMVDLEMAEEVRAVNSLSGGESFLVSLALALGLAGLSARDISVETLFIDEGFGSLDPESLEKALETLDSLQAQGRQVGLISHVQGLAEKIGAQVQVLPRGGGRSIVRVVAR